MSQPLHDRRRPAIGYVVNAYPAISETFLVNELRAMVSHDLPVVVLSLDPGPAVDAHADAAGLPLRVVRPPGGAWRPLALLWSNAAVAARAPGKYFRMFGRELASGWRGRRDRSFGRWPGIRRRLWRVALVGWLAHATHRLGVVHLHAFFADKPLEVARRAAALNSAGYSFAAHAKDLYTTPPSRLRLALARAHFATVCHADGYQLLRELAGDRARRVLYMRHGTDLDRFRPQAGPPREHGLLLAVGRLTPKKGFQDLVAACRLLRERGVLFRCIIVGDGRLRGELEAQIRTGDLAECVQIVGFQSQDALARWYRRATILVMPSRVLSDGNRDGIPNVVVEAMACGTPVLATRAGSIPEIIEDGCNGRLVDPEQPELLAAAIMEMLRQPADAGRLGRAAAVAVAQLDFARCAAPLLRKFERILARRGLDGDGSVSQRQGGELADGAPGHGQVW